MYSMNQESTVIGTTLHVVFKKEGQDIASSIFILFVHYNKIDAMPKFSLCSAPEVCSKERSNEN